jgi:hypothetical protein
VRVTRQDGRTLPVVYRYNGRRAVHPWTAVVHLLRVDSQGIVSVQVCTRGVAVLLETETPRDR